MNLKKERISNLKQSKMDKKGFSIDKDKCKEIKGEKLMHKEGELTDKELSAIAGGKLYSGLVFGIDRYNRGDIVQDETGVQYEIVEWDSDEYFDGTLVKVWFVAVVINVPESAKIYTNSKEGDIHYVNSSFVKKI